jgi:hypothetical protein
VGITSFDNLRTVEAEKKHKCDLLANNTGSLYKYKTRIISYVMTWDGVVTKFHKHYRHEIGLDNRIQAYVQFRVLKMTLEGLTMEAADDAKRMQRASERLIEGRRRSTSQSRSCPIPRN